MVVERIVVGVDGSDSAARALRWAISEGRLRGARVEVVHAWHMTYAGMEPYAGAAAFDAESLEAAARSVLEGAIGAADATGLAEPVQGHLVTGSAGAALVEAARGASLLVVGARGHGGFVGLLLGSVSQQVAHHAPCPVVIVPGAD